MSATVPNCDAAVHNEILEAKFRKALASRGVPAAGADALLHKIRQVGAASRTGLLSDERCRRTVERLVVVTERKAQEMAS